MKIGSTEGNGLNIFMGDNSRNQQEKLSKEGKGQLNGNTLFAGNLGIKQDSVLAKKAQAEKNAMKRLLDQHAQDQKISDGIDESKAHQDILRTEAREASQEISKYRQAREDLKTTYGISDDSQEQKDLELLYKSSQGTSLSEEETERLKNMGPLTEYQEAALTAYGGEKYWEDVLNNAANGIRMENQSIESTKQALLKVHPMVDAQKEAMKIIEAGRQEAIDMLMAEAKDKVDEDIKKREEAAEKKAEEKEKAEEQKKAAEGKEDPAVSETDIQKTIKNQDGLDKELKEMVEQSQLLEEELKGISVDIVL